MVNSSGLEAIDFLSILLYSSILKLSSSPPLVGDAKYYLILKLVLSLLHGDI